MLASKVLNFNPPIISLWNKRRGCMCVESHVATGHLGTISNTRATFAYHSLYDNLRLHVPLRHFLIVWYCFCTILNYYVLSKSHQNNMVW